MAREPALAARIAMGIVHTNGAPASVFVMAMI
jgi:hypothetical protein